ncbi:nitrogen regulation protein NR(II) [Roseovarius sp. M141]|uniref:two-component system sensor histidine kinase NtrB n=1 Tax=Roseovarius sp. M141 TaxID=2583806 RepID=UPI0020CDED58|nr:ATP-binding protein [Roseovarius sp. M141]MCQ0093197.1 PAS domain-containing sensor histidine kinase [Roseovarius sp. M141]
MSGPGGDSGLDRAVWGALPLPALVLDRAGCVTRINPAAEGFLNVSARAAQSMGLWDLLRVGAPPDAALRRARASGAPLFINDVDIGAGRHAPVRCSLSIAPLGSDEDATLVVVTPREMAGQMMQDASARIATRTAIGMTEMLAHEIKNPLAGITGAAQLLSTTLGAADRELTDLIVSESRRIAALLDQVERFGNPARPDLRAINIHDVLARARRSAQLGFASDMRIIEEYDPSLPEALGDPDMLQQVLQNLMKNAAEAAGPQGGTIRLRSWFEHGAHLRGDGGAGARLPLQIEVVDDGPGVPDTVRDALFEPFVSGRENGTGLGLAIAARIMADHGGWIAVASRSGHTVFRLSLPLATAAEAR